MSYIGSTPTTQSFIAGTDSFNGTGSATNFTLSRFVNSVNDVQVVVNNVVQYPPNYSVSGNTLTISPAPSAGTNNVYVRYLSTTLQSIAPSQGSSIQFGIGSAALPSISFIGDTNTGIYSPAADTIAFVEGGVEAMRIDSSANVGIGTSSPGARLDVSGSVRSTNAGNENYFLSDGSTRSSIQQSSNAVYVNINDNSATQGAFIWRSSSSLTERARINSDGNLLVNTATASARFVVNGVGGTSGMGFRFTGWGSGIGAAGTFEAANTSNADVIYFNTSAANVGKISITSTATSYVTNSDYRLKHDIAPMIGALAKVAQLKPVTYKWNLDNSESQGFIAHELQAVCPDAVTGQKDAVNEDGSIKPQGIDTSFLVATLTAAIQEQQAMIDTMKQEIAELKAKVGE